NTESQPFRDAAASLGEDAARVLDLARRFEGVVNGESIHACGVLVGDEPMDAVVPYRYERSKNASDMRITCWDGADVDDYGLLKLDVLVLRNLDIVSAATRLIA